MSNISKVFIYLSENENYIQKDVDKLLSLKLFTEKEIKTTSLLVCISRDYFDIPNETDAIMIRDQLSNVFCPRWRCNSIKYLPFLSIMRSGNIPEVYVMTKNKDIFENMDYFLQLSNFEKKFKMDISKPKSKFVEISTQIRREDVLEEGRIIDTLLTEAGYGSEDTEEYLSVPGFCFQLASNWWTRILNLYDVYPKMAKYPDYPNLEEIDRKEFIEMIMNPMLDADPLINEDLRSAMMEDHTVRETMYALSRQTIEKIDNEN